MSVLVWAGMAAVGGLGAIARFELDGLVQRRAAGEFPFGTLSVNVAGAFVLGLLKGADVGGDALFLVGTGALGSFTTFSTWMLETERLGEDGDGRLAATNVAASFAAGLGAAALGWAIGSLL
ncbi:MAG: fluoride efflux transporter CrcB [Actinomycetota bacterium]